MQKKSISSICSSICLFFVVFIGLANTSHATALSHELLSHKTHFSKTFEHLKTIRTFFPCSLTHFYNHRYAYGVGIGALIIGSGIVWGFRKIHCLQKELNLKSESSEYYEKSLLKKTNSYEKQINEIRNEYKEEKNRILDEFNKVCNEYKEEKNKILDEFNKVRNEYKEVFNGYEKEIKNLKELNQKAATFVGLLSTQNISDNQRIEEWII